MVTGIPAVCQGHPRIAEKDGERKLGPQPARKRKKKVKPAANMSPDFLDLIKCLECQREKQ